MSNAAIFGLKRRAWVAEEAFERLLELFEQDKVVVKVYDTVKTNSSIGNESLKRHVGRSEIVT